MGVILLKVTEYNLKFFTNKAFLAWIFNFELKSKPIERWLLFIKKMF